METIKNPFDGYGNIVVGDGYVRRFNDESVVHRNIIKCEQPRNLAIIGDHRVGKSSLVYNMLEDNRPVFLNNKVLPVWINIGSIDAAENFFRTLVNASFDKMVNSDIDIPNSCQFKEMVSNTSYLNWVDFLSSIKKYFINVRKAGYKTLFILDEFDHARNLFQGDKTRFQAIRDLSYYPDHRINYLTISRRDLGYIEAKTGTSTLEGIFTKRYLGLFDSHSLDLYFEKYSECGFPVNDDIRTNVLEYCGSHPYLLSMLGYEVIEAFYKYGNGNTDSLVDIAAKEVEHMFLDQYDRMIDLLKEDGSLEKLIQLIVGPIVDLKQSDVDALLRYGTVVKIGLNEHSVFSNHFLTYLHMVEREIALWPLWSDTEQALRKIIKTTLLEKYGESWLTMIRTKHKNLEQIFYRCELTQEKESKAFGSRATQELIDFTYPADLFAIIFSEWKESFYEIFGKDTNYWAQRSEFLSKIRNPLAHNRGKVLLEFEKTIAEGYCREILATIQIF